MADILGQAQNYVWGSQEALYSGYRSVSRFNKAISDVSRISEALGALTGKTNLTSNVKDKLSGPHNVCSLTPLDGGASIVAKFGFPNFPNEITDSDTANWNSISPMYRKGPIMGYSGSSAREVAFDLMFVASVTGGGSGSKVKVDSLSMANVKQKVDFLKASQYPDYDNWAPPPRFRLVLGKLMSLTGIITGAQVTWQGPFTHSGALPLMATVSIRFTEIERVPKSFRNMATGSAPKDFSGGSISDAASGSSPYTSSGTASSSTNKVNVPSGALGSLSAKYESNGNPGAITNDPADTKGGVSYGMYQFSTNTGSVQNFINNQGYAETFAGLTPGTDAFNAKWAEVAAADPEGFAAAQHAEILSTSYSPVVNGTTYANLGLDKFNGSPAFQNVVWSTAVQHGPSDANSVLSNALSGKDVSSMSEADVITAIYAERGKTSSSGGLAYFPGYKGNTSGLSNRFINERNTAIGMIGT